MGRKQLTKQTNVLPLYCLFAHFLFSQNRNQNVAIDTPLSLFPTLLPLAPFDRHRHQLHHTLWKIL